MKKLLILALSSITMFSTFALANPEAQKIGAKARAEAEVDSDEVKKALIVRVDKDGGNKTIFRYTGNASKVELPDLIKKHQSGKEVPGFVEVKDASIVKSLKNPEAQGKVAQQSWYYHRYGYRYGYNPGYGYYNGYWPRNYYYSAPVYSAYYAPVYYNWAPAYQWSCGYANYTYSIYW